MKIKVLQYNILNGLCSENRPYTLDVARKEAFFEVIRRENPDILTMCEASCRPFANKSENYRRSIEEMLLIDEERTKIMTEEEEKFRWAPGIITKFDIVAQDRSEYFKSFVRSTISLNNSTLVNLDVVHPRPELDEKGRNEFFSKVIGSGKKPYLISGDFNSLSPEDVYDPEKLTRGYQTFMGENNGKLKVNDILRAHAMGPLFSECLRDTYKLIRGNGDFTVPTDWRNKNKDSAVRLDYIFCSRDFRILDAGIIKSPLTENASDHYPTYAILEI